MRRRLLSPISPFDVVPPHVVDAAKRVFTLPPSNGTGPAPDDPVPFTTPAALATRRYWS
jgi:hypothetical protein